MRKHLPGFTLVEILMVMGIAAVIFTFSSVSVFEVISNNKINSTRNLLTSDIASQQVKAMNGETWQGNSVSWGINFQNNQYVLVPQNITVSMEGLTLANDFNTSKITFAAASGEITTINGESGTITVADPKGRSEAIKLNKYGKLVN